MKCYSKPINEHMEVPLADDRQLENLINHWTGHDNDLGNPSGKKRNKNSGQEVLRMNHCYVVSIKNSSTKGGENGFGLCDLEEGSVTDQDHNGQLSEIISLVKTQGDRVVGHEIITLLKPNPRTLLGTGKLKAIAERAVTKGADLLVLDAELSPSQMRNIEDQTGLSVSDREAVILNVFMKHAKTRRAKIQVEIAQLNYLRPRIRGLGLDMDQQASSIVTGEAPAVALGNLYQATSQALGNSAHNATTAQQQTSVTAQAATTMGVAILYSLDTAATGVATSKILS